MELLIYFALPLATVLLAIVLERVFHCPIYVTMFLFAIYLIVVFSLYAANVITDLGTALVALIIYTILAFISSYLFKIYRKIIQNENNETGANNELSGIDNKLNISNDINETNLLESSNSNIYECNRNCNTTGIAVNGSIIPNQVSGGRTGIVRGCYRRY